MSRLWNDEKIEFGEITDRLNILYLSIKVDNLVKVNELFPGENITYVANITGLDPEICSDTSTDKTSDTTSDTISDKTSDTTSNSTSNSNHKKF